jgi:hypothetical protein
MGKRFKRRLTIRGVLSVLVVAAGVRSALTGQYESLFVCLLTLALFAVPTIIERGTDIDLPPTLEAIMYIFIFSAEILGELDSFYTRIPHWDTILHTINGFIMAAVGFALVDIFNRSRRFTFELSPVFLALVAFCFSMTIGVLWEFFEFGMDHFFNLDMQKDTVVHTINSVLFNEQKMNIVDHVDIESLVVNGEDWIAKYGGYIDIGLIDTMKDLFVNFIGAVIFSVIGYFYVKKDGRGKFASRFIPVIREKEDTSQSGQ